MASLYQASQEQTILTAGDDGLPISGLKKRLSLQQVVMASLYQASLYIIKNSLYAPIDPTLTIAQIPEDEGRRPHNEGHFSEYEDHRPHHNGCRR